MPGCQITFSQTKPALVSIPEHGIVAGNSYWACDQELPDADGNPVRLIGNLFPQRINESPAGEPPRFAGTWLLNYKDCTQLGDGTITCLLGACVIGDCCYQTLEGLCPGEFQGPNTVCELPDCYEVGACCGAAHGIDCFVTNRITCPTQWFGAGRNCEEVPRYCKGACCIYDLENGTFCVNDTWPSQCRDFHDDLPEGVWTVWLGPETTCEVDGADCPNTGGCCRPPEWECENAQPEQCIQSTGPFGVPNAGVFMGLGNFCGPDTCNGACCANVFDLPGPPSPFIPGCVEDVSFRECEPGITRIGQFLGPGSTCEGGAAGCGVCCLIDPPTGEIICREDLLQTECLEFGGTPFGPGSDCAICDTVRRACCVPRIVQPGEPERPENCQAFTCVDVRNRHECEALRGIFNPDGDCPGVGFCIIFRAACCCPDPNDPDNCICFDMGNCDDCPPGCKCHNGAACLHEGQPPPPGQLWVCHVDCNRGLNCRPGP